MVDTLRISVGKQLGVSRHRIKLLREGQAQHESFAMTAWVDYWWLVWFCFEREVVGVEMNEFWWTTESSQFLDQVLNNSSTVRHGHAKKMMNSWRCGPFSQSTDLLVRQSDNHVFIVVFCQEETCTNQEMNCIFLLARCWDVACGTTFWEMPWNHGTFLQGVWFGRWQCIDSDYPPTCLCCFGWCLES